MTFGEMQAFTNRFIEILAIKDTQLRNTRLEALKLDIEDAYTNDPFANQLYAAAHEEIGGQCK